MERSTSTASPARDLRRRRRSASTVCTCAATRGRRRLPTAADVLRTAKPGAAESVEQQFADRGVERISVARLVPLDTRWRARRWADHPDAIYDAHYEESLALARETFDELSAGRRLDERVVRDLVQLLIGRVVSSHTALAQILAVKRYENLTYIHSVNVAVLSLLIGRKIGLTNDQLTMLVEAAVLHDIGKTRIPLDLVKKPGALDRRERKMMEAHPVLGAELLAQTDGLQRLTPVVALEHHRTSIGGGYPDLGDGVEPHVLSQIVSVADIYEAVTGARSYQDPTPPERACLLLARLARRQAEVVAGEGVRERDHVLSDRLARADRSRRARGRRPHQRRRSAPSGRAPGVRRCAADGGGDRHACPQHRPQLRAAGGRNGRTARRRLGGRTAADRRLIP